MLGNFTIDQRTYRLLMNNLGALPRRVGFKVVRVALNAWAGVVRNEARAKARKQTGLLQKSLVIKVKIPDASYNIKHHGKPAYAIVGPSRNVVGPVVGGKKLSVRKAMKHIRAGGKVQTRRPSRYAHLVERGHGGPHASPAYPFIEPAIRVGETTGFEKFAAKIQEGIAKEAAALPK